MEGPTPNKLHSPNPLTPVQNVSNFTARNIGPLKNSSLWYCNTCEGTLPAGNRNAILHIRGKNHRACRSKMEDLTSERIYCELCQTDVVKDFINQHNRILHQMEEEEVENSGASPTVSKTTKTQEKKRSEEDENIPNANSKKLQLILDAVTFTADDRVKKEKEFLQRYINYERRKNVFILRCNFCNLLSKSKILCEIHELSCHPIESAALKQLISVKK